MARFLGCWRPGSGLGRKGRLILTRGELPGLTPERPREPTGELERIFAMQEQWTRPTVLVPTCKAFWACVLSEDRLYARLRDPWDRVIDPRYRYRAALDWSSAQGELTPPRIQLERCP